MSYVMMDIEADGPIPGDYSMICFGAVIVEPPLSQTFYGQLRPISEQWQPEALAVSGFTREQTLAFPEPEGVMRQFAAWLQEHSKGRPMFISDNNGFDWQFINWYFHHFTGTIPFGFSSANLGSLYNGVVRDVIRNFNTCFKSVARQASQSLRSASANATYASPYGVPSLLPPVAAMTTN